MELGEDAETYMMSEGRKVGWEGFGEDGRGQVVEVVSMMKGGGKEKKKVRNPWESSASEFEKDETDRLGEESFVVRGLCGGAR